MLDNNTQNNAILSKSIVQHMIHSPIIQSIVSLLIAKTHVRKKLDAYRCATNINKHCNAQ